MINDKDIMEKQIEALTELEKIILVNRILSKICSKNLLFEPGGVGELINSEVIHESYKLLNKWIRQDNDVLRNEYNRFMMDNKNKGENGSKKVKETETG